MKPRVLHLTADFPDLLQPAKTRAISGLVDGTRDQFDHFVVSLNRQGGSTALYRPGHVLHRHYADQVLTLGYAAPPAVMAIGPAMDRLADRILQELAQLDFQPDLIQGHKLTIEGLLAQALAVRLGVPYVLTLQGNTDQKLLIRRPDRNRMMRKIWCRAREVMAFAPWTAAWCEQRLGRRRTPVTVIPCILPYDALIPPVPSGNLVRTAFHLDFWRNKNISTLLQAIARLAPQFPDLRLEIAGDGTATAFGIISDEAARLNLLDRVRLVGPVAPEAIQAWFNGAAVFALPTRRESFGMVFSEALLAGSPVLYPAGAAIDGFFETKSFARSVRADDTGQVAETLARMLTHQSNIKAELAAAQVAGELDRFRRSEVLAAYAAFLQRACARPARTPHLEIATSPTP